MAGQSPLFRDVVLGAAASATPSQKTTLIIPSSIQEQAVDTEEAQAELLRLTTDWCDLFKPPSQEKAPLVMIPEEPWSWTLGKVHLEFEAAENERSPHDWSPSSSSDNSTATTESLSDIWEGYYANPDTFGNWNPWQSKDFLSETVVDKQNALNAKLSSMTLDGLPYTYREPFSVRTSTLQLSVTPKHPVNFCNHPIQFQILVKNIPDQFSMSCGMLAARALGPTGEQYHCTIRNDGFTNTFLGCFFAGKETGFYVVQVQMLVPQWFQGDVENLRDGAIDESTNVLVSRNYLRDSAHSYSLQCIYQLPSYPLGQKIQKKHQSKLWGLTCDTQTNYIYYSDRDSHLIHCVDPEGRHISSFGQATRAGMLNARRPTGLAFDHVHRRLVVADKDNHRLIFFTPEGQYITSLGYFGNQNGEFNYPWDVAVSPLNGNIAVTDSKNKRVQLFGQFGDFRGKYGAIENKPSDFKPELDHPRGCSFDAQGRHLYVTDFNLRNVLEFTSDISFCRKLISDSERKLRCPQGLVVDEYGNILVADSSNNCVKIITREGILVSSINAMANQYLVFPVNLTTLAGGQLIVLDGERKLHVV